MERVFQIIAVVLAGIAAFFLYNGNEDATFITIVFACVSFFFSIRAQSKVRVEKENAEIIAEKYGEAAKGFELSESESFGQEFDAHPETEKVDEGK